MYGVYACKKIYTWAKQQIWWFLLDKTMSTCIVWAWLTTYWFIRVRIRPNSWLSAKLCDDAMVSSCFCLCCVPDGWLYKTLNINNLPAHIEQSSSHYDIYIQIIQKGSFLKLFLVMSRWCLLYTHIIHVSPISVHIIPCFVDTCISISNYHFRFISFHPEVPH